MPWQYVTINGRYVPANENILKADNRAFCYGDGLFETIRAYGTQPLFIEKHINRLLAGMNILQMNIPVNYTLNFFENQITRLLKKNRMYQGARVRLSVFRDSSGYYTPDDNNVSFIIVSSTLENEKYFLNKKGYTINLFKDLKKPVNRLSNIKTTNALIYVLASLYRKKTGVDDSLIFNEKGAIIESTSSNIFLLKGDILYTPDLTEGCLAGTMRDTILHLGPQLGLQTKEITNLRENNLLDVDEVFLTNAIQGVRWVMGFQNKRYYHKYAGRFISELNKLAID